MSDTELALHKPWAIALGAGTEVQPQMPPDASEIGNPALTLQAVHVAGSRARRILPETGLAVEATATTSSKSV